MTWALFSHTAHPYPDVPEYDSLFDRRLGKPLLDVVIPRMTADLAELQLLAHQMNGEGIVGLDEMNALLTQHGFELTPMKPVKKGPSK